MLNRTLAITLFFISFLNGLFSKETFETFLEDEIENLSFYMGYLIGRDHVKNSYDFPIKFEKLIQGMKAGMAGEPIPEQKDLVPLIKRMQKTVVEKQAALNLQEAENYLKTLSQKEGIIELEASKLFYFIEKNGNGAVISGLPWLHFKMSELKEGKLQIIYSTYDDKEEPLQVDLDSVIPGFQKGIQGMKTGESRTIYVHPDLAFGLGKIDISPNRLIVFEIVACQEQ